MTAILTLNAGSSSIKYAVFRRGQDVRRVTSGEVQDIGGAGPASHAEALTSILAEIDGSHAGAIGAVGHRVVHGGATFSAPLRIDETVLEGIRRLVPLAPLHQPHNIAGIEAARRAFPDAVQLACFDTAFHAGRSFAEDSYAIPRSFYDEGVRRYGFHGLSYTYVLRRLAEVDPRRAGRRVVMAHLGNGASLCLAVAGRSRATTMGFSALDGLIMGTRPGQIDPGVILWMLAEKAMSAAEISDLLYRRSGLKALSGLSSDMRTLEASSAPEAKEAIACFVERLCREIASLAAISQGIDALVFTGGIGEHSATIRARVMERLAWMGVAPDAARNDAGETLLTLGSSGIAAYNIATDEETVIAEAAMSMLAAGTGSKA